jgi:hypothetical protein
MNWTNLSIAASLAAALIVSPAMAYADDPAPPPLPGEPLPMPLPPGTQYAPPGVEVYCPNLVWVRRCHRCAADPAHQCWDR